MSSNPRNEQAPNFFNKPEVRAGIAVTLIGAIATPLIMQLKDGIDSRMGKQLNVPEYCQNPNLQADKPVANENLNQNLKLEQALKEAKTCAEIALKWEFGKHVTEKILNPKITTIEQLDETVVNIFQGWTKNNNKFYPSLSERNRGGLLFSAKAQEVKSVSDVIQNYLATPAHEASSNSNMDNPLFYYLSAKLDAAEVSANPGAQQALNQALKELNYTRQSLMQSFQTQYSIRVAKMLVNGQSEQLKKEYNLIDRIVDEADLESLVESLDKEKLDFGIKEKTTGTVNDVLGYNPKDKPELAKRLKTHLQILIATNKNIRFRLMQMLTENNQLTHQTPQTKDRDKKQVQSKAKKFLSLEEQLKQGATLVNQNQSQQLNPVTRTVTKGLGVDRILECPQEPKCEKTISSVWNKEALRLMAISSYTYMQKDHFLRFLVENNSSTEASMKLNPHLMARFNTKEGMGDQGNWFSQVKGEMGKNKGQLSEILEQPEKPLSECAIGCVRPLHDPLIRRYVEDMNLGLPSLESLNKELAEIGLGRIETVYLYYLQDIDNVIKPVYTFVYEAVKFSVWLAAETITTVATISAGFTVFVIGPVVADLITPSLLDGFMSVEMALNGGFIAKSTDLVDAAKLANISDDLVVIELGPNHVGRKISSGEPGLGPKVESSKLTKEAQDQISDYEMKHGVQVEVFEVENLGSFKTGRKDISVLDFKGKLNLVAEDTGKSILQVDKTRYNYTKIREKELAQIISDNPEIAESFGFRKGTFDKPDEKAPKVADDETEGAGVSGSKAGKRPTDRPDDLPSNTNNKSKRVECTPKVASLPKTSDGFLLAVKDRVMRLVIEPVEAKTAPCQISDFNIKNEQDFEFDKKSGYIVPDDRSAPPSKINNRLPQNFAWADKEYPLDVLEANMQLKTHYRIESLDRVSELKKVSNLDDLLDTANLDKFKAQNAGNKRLKDLTVEEIELLKEYRQTGSAVELTKADEDLFAEAQKLPIDGVKYDSNGFIEFDSQIIEEKYTLPGGHTKEKADIDAANKWYETNVDPNGIPDGYTWHHGKNDGDMELVPTALHKLYRHTGGNALNNVPNP